LEIAAGTICCCYRGFSQKVYSRDHLHFDCLFSKNIIFTLNLGAGRLKVRDMMANIRNRFSSSSRRRALFLRCSLLSVLVVAFCFGNVIWMNIIHHSSDEDLNTNKHLSEREKIAQMLSYLESNEHINRTACRLFYEFGGGINPNHKYLDH